MCAFYAVSRSGYYASLKHKPDKEKDMELVHLIEECQARHKRRYGYRRVQMWLRQEKGITINHKKALRLTRQYNLLSVVRRRRLHRYKPNGNLVYANVLNRDFHAERPNQKWVTDISYIIMPGGTLYLSTIRDLYDQSIVAYKTAMRQDYALVGRTIKAAMETENPQERVILHSDQGGQYRSFDYQHEMKEAALTPSMSNPGTPGDNAMAENFFSIFKTECIYLEKPKTPQEAERLTLEFIDYYNYDRLQLRTGMTPYQMRRDWFDAHIAQA